MVLVDLSKPPSRSMQRWFGASLAVLLMLLGYLSGHMSDIVRYGLWAAGILVALVYYCLPRSQVPIIRAWQYLTWPLAWAISHLLLALAFFGVFLPIGLMLRCWGYDPLKLRQQDAESDWIERKKPTDVTRYFKQF